MATKIMMRVEDLYTLPDGGERYELIDGEPRERSVGSAEYGRIGGRLSMHLNLHVLPRSLGVVLNETHFRIQTAPDRARVPDVAFLEAARWELLDPHAPAVNGAPDLAIEIVSPSDKFGDVHAKALEWIGAGARVVWVLQPVYRTVTVYGIGDDPVTLTADDTVDGGDVLPGFRMPVRTLFE